MSRLYSIAHIPCNSQTKAAASREGHPNMIETIAKAGIATGADGLFIETHPIPSKALSDGANMLPLEELQPLLAQLIRLRAALKTDI